MPTFQRNISFPHLGDLFPGLIHTLVSPSTEMESKRPSWLPERLADQFTILFDDFLRGRSREEVEVKGASNESVLDERLLSRIRG